MYGASDGDSFGLNVMVRRPQPKVPKLQELHLVGPESQDGVWGEPL